MSMLKACVFIDGANLYATCRQLQFDMDYKRLRDVVDEQYNVIRMNYYTAIRPNKENDFDPLKPLLDYISYNGYKVVSKGAKEFTDSAGRVKVKGNMDIEICVDMIRAAAYADVIILMSGDGDFTYAVEALQQLGKKVIVCSTVVSNPRMCADELRRACDEFWELDNIANAVMRVDKKISAKSRQVDYAHQADLVLDEHTAVINQRVFGDAFSDADELSKVEADCAKATSD